MIEQRPAITLSLSTFLPRRDAGAPSNFALRGTDVKKRGWTRFDADLLQSCFLAFLQGCCTRYAC
jgi:hypothetical protein